MRLALLTDLHANREALTACLAHAEQQRADQYAFTGDFVGYGADPCAVLDTVMKYVANGAVAVQGNHDMSVLRDRNSNMNLEALQVIEWTRTQLSPVQRNFLAELPLTMERDHLMFVHASAHEPSSWEYVRSAEQAERSLKATSCRMVFSGHVHRPALYRRADDGHMGGHAPVAGKRIALAPQHQYLVIPGSCGQPRDGNPTACYALYDDTAREITYHRVPYDVNGATRRVIEAGLPIIFAMRLVEGI